MWLYFVLCSANPFYSHELINFPNKLRAFSMLYLRGFLPWKFFLVSVSMICHSRKKFRRRFLFLFFEKQKARKPEALRRVRQDGFTSWLQLQRVLPHAHCLSPNSFIKNQSPFESNSGSNRTLACGKNNNHVWIWSIQRKYQLLDEALAYSINRLKKNNLSNIQ